MPPVWFGWKDRVLRTPAKAQGEVLNRRVEGCCREHCCGREVVKRVARGVGVEGSSSKRCTGVRGGMVDVCGVCVRAKAVV